MKLKDVHPGAVVRLESGQVVVAAVGQQRFVSLRERGLGF